MFLLKTILNDTTLVQIVPDKSQSHTLVITYVFELMEYVCTQEESKKP